MSPPDPVVVDELMLDSVRDACRNGRLNRVLRAPIGACTLGTALEFACWAATEPEETRPLVAQWRATMASLDLAYSALVEGTSPSTPGAHDAPPFELRLCPTALELRNPAADTEWAYFQDRFRRSLANTLSLSPRLARGIAAALGEMVDNVVQHAGLGDTPTALVAYQVTPRTFSMAVADTGCGILSSLRENPTNRNLSSDSAALTAAVMQAKSRRTDGPGTGFRHLRQALADLQGRFCFRSGSARLQLDGRGSGERIETFSNSPKLLGFQVSVAAAPASAHIPPL